MQLSVAERQALGGAALVLLVQALVPLHGALEYRQALVASQPWRTLTAHLVHVNWVHALLNLAAWLVVARLFAPELRTWRQPLVLAVAALAVTLHLALLHPGIAWYRGFSGTLHGVFFAGATAWLLALLTDGERRPRALWLPAVLVAGGWVKVLAEQPGGSLTPYAQWLGAGIVPQAHLAGAVAGSMLGLLFAWAGPREPVTHARN
ncbi:MAG: rhombosortase [Burkholderiales bacterium]|jgi:rhomboid family GlyGly-CTERM serine protease|nr:rhombosortase [Burkholderiales bacterium]MCA3228433.1 rhombosortase [Burkholderiales bacterium]